MKDFGYVAISFIESEKKYFSNIVKQLCNPDDFYKSNVVNYLNGDVTDNLHMTLFYGLLTKEIDKYKIQKTIDLFTQKYIFITKLSVKFGYRKLYKIIELEVEDKEFKLLSLVEDLKKFPNESSVQLKFEPHITLAYVKPSFEPNEILINKKLEIETIKYYSS